MWPDAREAVFLGHGLGHVGAFIYIDPEAARGAYMKKLQAHCAALEAICRKLGVSYYQLSTAQPLDTPGAVRSSMRHST